MAINGLINRSLCYPSDQSQNEKDTIEVDNKQVFERLFLNKSHVKEPSHQNKKEKKE